MKKIVVPVDFSTASENAATFAGELAAFYNAEMYLYHSYEIPVPLGDYTYPFVSVGEMQSASEFELEAFKNTLAGKLKVPVTTTTKVENNTFRSGLIDYCNEIKPDLVVMALSGKNALTRLIVGSNTIYAVQHLTYPVLVIPPKAQFVPVRSIGFACDYSKVLETTPVAPIKKILRDFNADLHIMNVENGEANAEKVSESGNVAEIFNDCKPEYHTVAAPDITTGINFFAGVAKADWIVVIPKKHNLTEKLFSRSHTKDLLYHTTVPVLCIHHE